MQFRTYNP